MGKTYRKVCDYEYRSPPKGARREQNQHRSLTEEMLEEGFHPGGSPFSRKGRPEISSHRWGSRRCSAFFEQRGRKRRKAEDFALDILEYLRNVPHANILLCKRELGITFAELTVAIHWLESKRLVKRIDSMEIYLLKGKIIIPIVKAI